MQKAKLVIHPVRLRILQSLSASPKTTGQIAGIIKDVPLSTLYRYLRLLHDGGMIGIQETRLVHGIQEKRYELVQAHRLVSEDIEDMSREEHLQLFATYFTTLIQGFSNYVNSDRDLDFAEERTGYTEIDNWANQEELDTISARLNNALAAIMMNKPGPKRRLHKFAVINYPLNNSGAENG